MPEIKINNNSITCQSNETVLDVANRAGIHIPTMCWIKDFKPSTSCMVCVVQDKRNNKIITSCSALVEDGMDIITNNEEVLDMRKSALELLLSEHQGDCEAPCQRVCPAEMDIPLMNRLIAANKMDEAIHIVRETIALPEILGYICPAPCEKACRRKDIDEAVSICLLKRFTAETDLKSVEIIQKSLTAQNVAIIGAGPAGLAAAFYLVQKGYNCDIFDSNELAGGKMRTDIVEEKLPQYVLDKEIERIKSMGVNFYQNQTIDASTIIDSLSEKYQFIVFAVGSEKTIETENFEKTNLSELKELEIFRVKNCPIFVPKQISYKSKMAVRATASGRKCSEWILMFIESGIVSTPEKKFNSVYNRIKDEEQAEFLKDAENHDVRIQTETYLKGFTIEQAISEAGRCLHCDCRKKDNCSLRTQSSNYKASQRVYTLAQPANMQKNTEHPEIVLETLKCIKCGICIQTAQNTNDSTGFAFSGRGFDVKISIPIEKSINNLSKFTAISCAKNCPTGAISIKK